MKKAIMLQLAISMSKNKSEIHIFHINALKI